MSATSIGVFDSGLGGLTVLSALLRHLPQEHFVYLGDTARLPYGSKSLTTIHRYVEQNLAFLSRQGVKAVVIACNSASAAIRHRPITASVPLFEVIGPGAQAALAVSTTKRIGVVGTWATINDQAYETALKSLDAQAKVFSQACPLLVPLVEEGWTDDPLTNLVVHRYVGAILGQGIDTLILGCTHYPALRDSFSRVVGPQIHLIDSATAIAEKLKIAIRQGEVPAREPQGEISLPHRVRLLTTDRTARFAEIAARLLGVNRAPAIELVDL